MSSRKKRLEALEALYGKRESATDDEPMILRFPELYNTYVNICQTIGKEPADLDAIRREYEEDRALKYLATTDLPGPILKVNAKKL